MWMNGSLDKIQDTPPLLTKVPDWIIMYIIKTFYYPTASLIFTNTQEIRTIRNEVLVVEKGIYAHAHT